MLPLAQVSGLADATSAYDDPIWYALFDELPRGGSAFNIVEDSAVIAWLGDPDGVTRRALERLGANDIVVASSRPTEGSGVHAALHLARALAPLGASIPDTADALRRDLPPLRIPAADESAAEAAWQLLRFPPTARVVALHAGSGGAAKRWPPRFFAALATRLRESGFSPLLIEGPQDDALTATIQDALPSEPLPVVRGLSVGALASLLRRCSAYLGNDSGVSHLAALAGVPTIALFGPSDPSLWSPLGLRVAVLRSPSSAMRGITVDEATAALLAILAPD